MLGNGLDLMTSRAGAALAAAAMFAALAAIWVSGHGLVCAAWRGEDSVRAPALCGGPRVPGDSRSRRRISSIAR